MGTNAVPPESFQQCGIHPGCHNSLKQRPFRRQLEIPPIYGSMVFSNVKSQHCSSLRQGFQVKKSDLCGFKPGGHPPWISSHQLQKVSSVSLEHAENPLKTPQKHLHSRSFARRTLESLWSMVLFQHAI